MIDEEDIGNETVYMRVKIQATAKLLHEGDGSGLAIRDPEVPTPSALPRKHGPKECTEDRTQELAIDREPIAERPGHGQHPLAIGRFWKELVTETGRRRAHAPCLTARAEPPFARKRGRSAPSEP